MKRSGFTLIELLVTIAIIAIIVGFAMPNFLGVRERAADSKKKSEVQQLKNALRLYYNDFNKYPQNYNGGVGKINYIKGCGIASNCGAASDGSCNCPCNTSVDFAAGGAGCDTVYMKKFPSDLGWSMYYYPVEGNTDDFCLKVPMSNMSDPDIAKSQAKCGATVAGGPCHEKAGSTDFAICAD